MQYITTVNQDQLDSIREQFSEGEYTQVIQDNIRLELTDDSPASKLLGIQIDMQY